ncbi:MAG TPA: protein kinase, partial [Gemmatimonadales bacterium]|nr:protein kinase [Gemmatimonadales bacterium]
GKKVDARSDIFSFGVLLYELISGRQPFRGDNRLSVLSAIVRDEPEKLAVPPDLERLISRALRKDPERRAQSMADLRNGLADLKEETESGAAAPAAPPARRRRSWIPAAALSILAVAGVAAWVRFGRTQPEAPLPPPRVVPFTSFPGSEIDPAFSPDGNQIAFSWDGEKGDNFDIYVKLIGAGAPLRLTTNPAPDRHPAWSPDGKHIAFHRATGPGERDRGAGPGGQGEIWTVPALGGTERKVASGYSHYGGAGAVAWSPDGRSLALADRESPREPISLFLLSLETGEKQKLTTPSDISYEDTSPAFSPDGRSLAFVRSRGTSTDNVYLLALDPQGRPSGDAQRLSFVEYLIYGLAWSPDGRSIVFSFSTDVGGSRSLSRVSVGGRSGPGKPERLASFGGDISALSISRQGRLAYQQSVQDVNIWRRPGPRGTGSPVQIIASTKLETAAQYSPDGRRIAFHSDRSGTGEIWVSNSDGSGAVPVTSMNGPATGSPRWSPDGRSIAFDSTKHGHRDIFVVGAEGGFLRRLTTEPSEDVRPSWSIDGRWIYFGSN